MGFQVAIFSTSFSAVCIEAMPEGDLQKIRHCRTAIFLLPLPSGFRSLDDKAMPFKPCQMVLKAPHFQQQSRSLLVRLQSVRALLYEGLH
jgi:hypothetical protein